MLAAHVEGCRFVRDQAMVAVEAPYDVVVTTNSGYPLGPKSLPMCKRDERGAADCGEGRRDFDGGSVSGWLARSWSLC